MKASSSSAKASSSSKKSSSSAAASSSSEISSSSVAVSSSSKPVSSSVESSSSGTNAIAHAVAFERGAVMVRCQVFDMNGQLIKSANVKAGSVSEVWNNVKADLVNGAYVVRFGDVDGRNMRIVQVKK